MKRLILPADSPVLSQLATEVLYIYPNGDRLINVEDESELSTSTLEEVNAGVQLPKLVTQEETELRQKITSIDSTEEVLAYVEFIGPIAKDWLNLLIEEGIEVLCYQPRYSYLCKATVGEFLAIKQKDIIEDIIFLSTSLKQATEVSESGETAVTIIHVGQSNTSQEIITALNKTPGVSIHPEVQIEQVDFYLRIAAKITGEGRDNLLATNKVMAIEPIVEIEPEGETANLIISGHCKNGEIPTDAYLDWLKKHNLGGNGTTISIVDTGVDIEHEAFSNRIKDLAHGKKGWHGTFVAGCAAGDYRIEKDANGKIGGLGVAPKANLISISNEGVTANPSSKCKDTVNQRGNNGAYGYIQNNSWGAGTSNPMNYSSLEASYDRLVRNADPDSQIPKPLIICFSSGNRGRKGLTRPKSAKNIIVTGNSESIQDIGGTFSDNKDDVYFDESWQPSSIGNCGDRRIRPHIVAPGEWTIAANYGMKPGHLEYISPKLTWCGGSSAASPKTAGACAILVDWWKQNNSNQLPSPAMVRALIVNGAAPMLNSSQGQTIVNNASYPPNELSGWGRLNLESIIEDDVRRFYLDQSVHFKNRGDNWEMDLIPDDPSKPIKITLTWTDPPGNIYTGDSIDNPAIINRMILKAKTSKGDFLGNNFEKGWSISGELPNPKMKGIDNTQNIFLSPDESRTALKVVVEALEITTNCFDFSPTKPEQDFALVIHNAYPANQQLQDDLYYHFDKNATVGSQETEEEFPDDLDWQWEIEEKNSTDDINWWLTEDNFNWYSESYHSEHQSSEGEQELETIMRKEKEGINIIHLTKNHVSTPENGERTRVNLSNFLKQISSPDTSSTKKVVLGISPETKITAQDLKRLREICFMGDLYLVSSSQSALYDIVQMINRKTGIHIRHTEEPLDLANLYMDTLIASNGGYPAKVHSGLVKIGNIEHRASGIDCMALDKKLTIQIQSTSSEYDDLKLVAPQGEILPVHNLETPSGELKKGISFRIDPLNIVLEIDLTQLTAEQAIGRWSIINNKDVPLTIKAWVWSQNCFNTRFRKEKLKTDGNKTFTQSLLAIEGQGGIKFSRVDIITKKLGTPSHTQQEESEKRTVLRPLIRTKNIDHTTSENQASNLTSTMSKWIEYEKKEDESLIYDLNIRLNGTDGQGNPFQRALHLNKIELGTHRKSHIIKELRQFVATVRKMYYLKGDLKALRLKSQYGERDFKLSQGFLTEWIEDLDLLEYPLEFTARGSNIVSIAQVLHQGDEDANQSS